MSRVQVGRVALAYDDEGAGTPVVLVHGFTLDRRMWDEQVPALRAAGYRVVRPDLRGHGESDAPPTGYAPDDHAEDLMRLFDALDIPSAHLVGLSLGGGVAATFATRCPKRTRSMTLIDAILPGRPFGDEFNAFAGEMARLAQAGDLRGALDHWAKGRLFYPTNENPTLAARLAAMYARFSGVQFYDRAAPRSGPTVADLLETVRVPTLVLIGALDLDDLQRFAREYAERLPDVRLQTIAGAGHMANMDQPDAVNAALIAFLREVDGRG